MQRRQFCISSGNWLLMIVTISSWLSLGELKQFQRCELARILVEDYRIDQSLLSTWICLIDHESERNTALQNRNSDGSHGYGLFQLKDKDACGVDRPAGMCNKRCQDFTNDNIDDDVDCAKLILNTAGFKYWKGWHRYCTNWNSLPNLKILCNSDTFTRRPSITRRSFNLNNG